MNGKEINLTGDDINIKSNCFNVNKQGIVELKGTENASLFTVYHQNNSNYFARVMPRTFYSSSSGNTAVLSTNSNYGMLSMNTNGITTVALSGKADNPQLVLQDGVGGSGEISINSKDLEISSNYSIVAKVPDYFLVKDSLGDEIIAFGSNGIYPHRTIDMQGDNIINAGNVSSDRRLKKDIQNSNISAIDRIMEIQHHEFTWKKDNEHEDIGYIAQELEEIDANYVRHNVTKDEQGNVTSDMYEVRILPLLSTATKAIQEQQKIIEELKNRIEKLESDKKG